MQLSGETEIAAARQRVWETLIDPGQIAACVPGQPQVTVIDERHMQVRAPIGNAWFRTTVVIDIQLTDLQAPERASATASGSVMGGPITATGGVVLTELGPARTKVAWTAELTLGGMLAGFAAMAEGPSRDGLNRTIECLRAKLEAAQAAKAG